MQIRFGRAEPQPDQPRGLGKDPAAEPSRSIHDHAGAAGARLIAGETALGGGVDAAGAARRPSAAAALAAPRAGLPNVRVNHPAADHFQVDQTTQSETTIAVSARNVAVGYNDSQQALLSFPPLMGST